MGGHQLILEIPDEVISLRVRLFAPDGVDRAQNDYDGDDDAGQDYDVPWSTS